MAVTAATVTAATMTAATMTAATMTASTATAAAVAATTIAVTVSAIVQIAAVIHRAPKDSANDSGGNRCSSLNLNNLPVRARQSRIGQANWAS